jgi:eukaryotic-like serine/threonine-protein kinase
MVGNYQALATLGKGGTATVYLGIEVGTSRLVAIKRLHDHLADDVQFSEMLFDEARLGARLRHPNILPVLEVIAHPQGTCAVMDYVHGITLSELVRRASVPIPLPIVVAIVDDILQALSAAHTAKQADGSRLAIIHRDVAPDNILLNLQGLARLTDFGIAKSLGRSHKTATGVVKGKFRYMAPEQAGGESYQESDVFSLAIIAWELLTGARLFDAEHEATVLMQVLSKEIPRPSSLRAEIPKALDAVLLKALSRDIKTRFSTASALRTELLARAPRARAEEVAEWLETHLGSWLEERDRFVSEHCEHKRPSLAPLAALSSKANEDPSGVGGLQTRTSEVMFVSALPEHETTKTVQLAPSGPVESHGQILEQNEGSDPGLRGHTAPYTTIQSGRNRAAAGGVGPAASPGSLDGQSVNAGPILAGDPAREGSRGTFAVTYGGVGMSSETLAVRERPRSRARTYLLAAVVLLLSLSVVFGFFLVRKNKGVAPQASVSVTEGNVTKANGSGIATAGTSGTGPSSGSTEPTVGAASGSTTAVSTSVVTATPAITTTGFTSPRSTGGVGSGSGAQSGPRPPGSKAKPDCNPPYTVDAKGFRVYRRECLQ